MRESETLINWNCVGNSFTDIQYDTGRSARCVQTKHSGWGKKESRSPKRLEKDFGNFVAVLTRVKRSLCHQDRVIFCTHIKICFRVNVLP
mmetsp:Transcript_129669/g.363034  ORF Transcript_129669/g.363034 Transcript_129669/m.363034 type:complete len:90 (+) Transcript_129669:532-801(+)